MLLPGCRKGSTANVRDGLLVVAVPKVAGAQDALEAPEYVLCFECVAMRVAAGFDTDFRHFGKKQGFTGYVAANLSSESSDHLRERRKNTRLPTFLIA